MKLMHVKAYYVFSYHLSEIIISSIFYINKIMFHFHIPNFWKTKQIYYTSRLIHLLSYDKLKLNQVGDNILFTTQILRSSKTKTNYSGTTFCSSSPEFVNSRGLVHEYWIIFPCIKSASKVNGSHLIKTSFAIFGFIYYIVI